MPLTPADVGRRVVVRRVLAGERGPSGGTVMSDVLGVLERFDEQQVAVRREDGTRVAFARPELVTGKPVPPRPSPRPRVHPEQLERICSAGWPPPVREPLGDWVLRAAGGFTRRANSCLVAGEPDRPLSRALDAVRAFYAEHGLTPHAQLVAGSDWQQRLVAAGWVDPVPHTGGVLVQVAPLARARRAARSTPGAAPMVTILDRLDADWLTAYQRACGGLFGAVGEPGRRVLTGGGQVGFARIGDPIVAVGRAVVTGDWLGLAAVEVTAEHRRQGKGRAIVDALLGWGAERGPTSAYLQVTPDNIPALRLYERYGFGTHHRYVYAQPPD